VCASSCMANNACTTVRSSAVVSCSHARRAHDRQAWPRRPSFRFGLLTVSPCLSLPDDTAVQGRVLTHSDRVVADLARVFASHASVCEQLLDDAAAIIGEAAGGLCVIGVGISGSTMFDPVGVYNDEPGRLVSINDTPGFVWPVSERASLVLASGETFRSAGSIDTSGHAESELASAWRDVLQESGSLSHMMLAIRFAGASVGIVVVARRLPGWDYTEEDERDLEGPVDVLALALHELSIRPDHDTGADSAPQVTRSNVATLSGQERQIVVLLAQGLTSAEMAETMYLSVRTVEWYRARILQKLDHPSRVDLVALGRSFRD
jgi:DNA-binding CsgD family transcriptional regulator